MFDKKCNPKAIWLENFKQKTCLKNECSMTKYSKIFHEKKRRKYNWHDNVRQNLNCGIKNHIFEYFLHGPNLSLSNHIIRIN